LLDMPLRQWGFRRPSCCDWGTWRGWVDEEASEVPAIWTKKTRTVPCAPAIAISYILSPAPISEILTSWNAWSGWSDYAYWDGCFWVLLTTWSSTIGHLEVERRTTETHCNTTTPLLSWSRYIQFLSVPLTH